jgi:triacylglycerol lipase
VRSRGLRACVLITLAIAFGAACDPPPEPGSTRTRFPVVLAEGLFGFDFFGIPEDLRAGGAVVFTTQVNPFSTNEARAAELLTQIQTILTQTGAPKVNLIGHSQGGLDARVLLAMRPGILASVTQIGSPNTGSAVADAGLLKDDFTLLNIANTIGIVSNIPPSAAQFRIALNQLSTPGMAAFNQRFPAGLPTSECGQGPASVNGVALFSFGGIGVNTNPGDISDLVLGGALFGGFTLDFPVGVQNDGLVARCATHFGAVIRDDLQANHTDLVNQLNGAIGADRILPVYRAHLARLAAMGL